MRKAGMVLVAVLALGTATTASAGSQGAKSRIAIKELSATGASGVVTSKRPACLKKRKVSLFTYDGFITDKIAITSTNRKGKWAITRDLKPGTYFAKVDASKGCRYDNSKRKQL